MRERYAWAAFTADRPVAVWMATLAVVVFGLVSLGQLPLSLLPDLSYPSLTVRTTYSGAAPEEVERAVTDPIEDVVGTVENVVAVESASRPGISDVTLRFRWGTRLDLASQRVRERLDVLELPSGTSSPTLLRFDPALDPVLRIAVTGDLPPADLARYARESLEPELQRLPGVATVRIRGEREEVIRVAVDANRATAAGVDIAAIESALRSETVNVAGGRLRDAGVEYLVRTVNELTRPAELEEIAVGRGPGGLTRLRDVATVTRELLPLEVVTRVEGRPAVEVAVYKDGDANVVAVSNEVAERLSGRSPGLLGTTGEADPAAEGSADAAAGPPPLARIAPRGIKLEIVGDQATFVRAAIREVADAALMGSIWSVLAIFLFLRSALSTVAIGLAIPISAVVTFAGMRMLDVSLNIMSLGGLALGTGMVVDDAIVVLEAIARRRALGDNARTAAIQGVTEVGAAVAASTLTTVAVFAPLGFIEGVAGQIFGDLAWTVVLSLLASLVFSLLFIPMFAATLGQSMVAGLARRVASEEGIDHQISEGEGPQAGARSLRPGYSPEAWRLLRRDIAAARPGAGATRRALRWVLAPVVAVLAVARYLVAQPIEWLGWLLDLLTRLLALVVSTVARTVVRLLSWIVSPVLGGFAWSYDLAARGYDRLLSVSLRAPAIVLLATAALSVAAWVASRGIGLTLLPEMRQGQLLVEVELPPGTPIDVTSGRVAALERRLVAAPGISRVASTIGSDPEDSDSVKRGPNRARLTVETPGTQPLALEEARARATIDAAVAATSDLRILDVRGPSLLAIDTPIAVDVSGRRLDALARSADTLASALRGRLPGAKVGLPAGEGLPELRIRFDHEKVAAYGIDARSAAESVRRAVQGVTAAEVRESDRTTDVRILVDPAQLTNIDDLRRLPVRAVPASQAGGPVAGLPSGAGSVLAMLLGGASPGAPLQAGSDEPVRTVPLDAVATIEAARGPVEIAHADGERVIRLPVEGSWLELSEMRDAVLETIRRTPLEPGIVASLRGQSAELDAAAASTLFALLLAIFLVYAVMAATFESFSGPFIILLTIPLAGISVAFALRAIGEPVSAVVGLGSIILAGIVVKNAIVLLDAVGMLRRLGQDRVTAIRNACSIRLRPVIMTALTTIVGVIPMMLDEGAGAEIRRPLGWVLGSGLAGSTLLTLIIIPVVYDRFDAWRTSRLAASGSRAD